MNPRIQQAIDSDGGAESITALHGQGIGLTSIDGIEACKALKDVWLNGNLLADVSPLQALPGLERVYVHDNPLSRLPNVTAWPQLSSFSFGSLRHARNELRDVSALARVQTLQVLTIQNTRLRDLEPLANLPIWWLTVWDNEIADLSPLVRMKELARLSIGHNPILDFAPLLELPKLRSLSVGGLKVPRPVLNALRKRGVSINTSRLY